MTTAKQICDAVGRDVLSKRIPASKQAISNAIAADRFPASWYRIIKEECTLIKQECPMDLFGFKAGEAR